MNCQNDLEESIFKTIAWFSIFEYPLTVFEIYKWLWSPDKNYKLSDVYSTLNESSWLKDRLVQRNSFFALKQSKPITELIKIRNDRFLDANRKYIKLVKAVKKFRFVPGVSAVAAANTLAWWHTKEQSDIDLFIIVKPSLIWSTRFLLILPFALTRRRPALDKPALDPFCFSFFLSSNFLSLENLCLEGSDPYMAYWVRSLVPIFDRENTFEKFEAVNVWSKKNLPNAAPRKINQQLCVKSKGSIPFQTRLFEKITKSLQKKYFPKYIRDLANIDTRVIVNDNILKFHANDRKEEYRQRWNELIKTQ